MVYSQRMAEEKGGSGRSPISIVWGGGEGSTWPEKSLGFDCCCCSRMFRVVFVVAVLCQCGKPILVFYAPIVDYFLPVLVNPSDPGSENVASQQCANERATAAAELGRLVCKLDSHELIMWPQSYVQLTDWSSSRTAHGTTTAATAHTPPQRRGDAGSSSSSGWLVS